MRPSKLSEFFTEQWSGRSVTREDPDAPSWLRARMLLVLAAFSCGILALLLLIFALCICPLTLNAQQPVGFGTTNTPLLRVPGLVKWLDWQSQTAQGNQPAGDTHFPTAWLPNASGLPVTSGLPVVGTLNDFDFGSCAGDIGVIQFDTFTWASPTTAHATIVNCLTSQSAGNWHGMLYSGGPDNSGSGSWKSRAPWSKGGILYLPIERQIHAGTSSIHDATIIMSPDSGAHWCNPYTWANRAGSPGCDSSNWHADGDIPTCGASAPANPCTDASYTDATHPSMMWHQIDNVGGVTNGGENWSPVNFGNQDGASVPSGAGVESGCDPATSTALMLLPGDNSIACVPNASVMDISAWKYYTCSTISQSRHCPGTDSNNWTPTFANRTGVARSGYDTGSGGPPGFNGPLIAPNTVMYVKDYPAYCMSGQQTDFMCSYTLQGPWVMVQRYWPAHPLVAMFSPGLGYTTLGTNPPHVQVTLTGNNYFPVGAGSPEFGLFDMTLGKTYGGDAFQFTQLYPNSETGAGFQFSTGNVAGSFPRRGLNWSFDFYGQLNSAFNEERGNNSASIVGCTSDYGATPNCGSFLNGTVFTTSTGLGTQYMDTSSVGHWQVVPADFLPNSTASATPSAMQGNGTYSVAGVFQFNTPVTAFRLASVWCTGQPGADNSQSKISLDFDSVSTHLLSLNWGTQFVKHWQIVANAPITPGKKYFIVVTVQAQTGCGTGCVPVAHLWVSADGVTTDLFAGQAYTAVAGASTSAKTPAVLPGPFTLGLDAAGGGTQSSTSFDSFMVYNRALSSAEVGFMYKSMTAKMRARGVDIGPPPPALTFTPSPTQIAVSYTAPSGSACTVEASESSSYSPLVHDVDTVLFAGSDQDNRTDGGISDGTRRVFVLGKRLWATALDAKIYSRALQAYTPYFFRITCGATVMTGSATTANIPLNSTYQDLPQLDRSTPGNTVMPAYPTSRSDSWNWPTTGAKVVPVSLSSDIPYDPMNTNTSGPFLWSEGARRVCNASILTPVTGPQGYLCQYQQGDGGPEAYYFIVPSTGERRYLGIQGGLGAFNAIDGKFYGGNGTNITVREYNGTYASGSISFTSPTVLVSNILTLIMAFDATFDPTLFTGCGGEAIGDYIHFSCSRGAQDSYAWVGSLKISTAAIISATRFDNNIRTRWCACHHILAAGYDLPMMEIIPHEFVDGGLGQGPYITTLTGNINASVTTINVAGEPACASCGTDPGVPLWRVGDVLQIGSSGAGDLEYLQITTKTSSTVLQVSRGARGSTPHSHSTSDVVTGSCDQTIIMWKFAADPHGTDTTNTNFVQDFVWQSVGGHDDATTDQLLSESGNGWVTRVGNLITEVGQPYTALIPAAFTFAGKSANCNGNACRKHPASGAPGSNFFGDFPDFDFVGTANGAPTLANVTGTLYKVTSNMPAIDPKHYSIAAVVGAEFTNPTVKSILDVSGPSVTIGGGSGDNFKMVIANVAGEGFSGSAAGDIYINVPGGSITVPSTTQTTGETHSGTAVSGGTTLTLYSVSGGCMGCNTTYYWSSYTGPFPTTSMSFTVTGFADPNNNVTATPTSIQPSTCDNSTNLCIANFSRYANGAAQIGTDGTSGRILASLPLRNSNDYPTFKVLADGSYMLYAIGSAATAEHWDAPSNVVMVKLPPFTAPDIKDRSTFLRATLPTVTPPAGTVTAAVEFGYVEQGTVAQHYCTSRREACVAVSSTVTDATPYWFESTDFTAGRYTRIPCTVSCTATLPVLPSHTAYFQWKFYDSGGSPITTTGYNGLAVEDTVR